MTQAIYIDGSNCLFWQSGQRCEDAPLLIIRALVSRRLAPVVYFDNSIHLHLGAQALDGIAALGQVIIVPKGSQADPKIIEAAVAARSQIVTNDRFHDWRKVYPFLRNDTLVTGHIAKGGRVQFSKKLRPAPL